MQGLLRRSLSIVPVTLAALLLSSCRPESGDKEVSRIHEAPLPSNLDVLKRTLGSGFDSKSNLRSSQCIKASDYVYAGVNHSDMSLLRDFSYDDLMNEMSAGVFGKMNLLGLVSVRVQGDVIGTLATTDESTSFVYRFQTIGKSLLLKQAAFSEIGHSAVVKNDPLAFRKICGDEYVQQVNLGGELYIGVSYQFTNKVEKAKAMLNVSGSALWGLIKFHKTLSKEQQQALANMRITVSAFQIGGDGRKLEALKKDVHQGSCASNDIEKCSATLDKLIAYAKQDFAGQLNNMEISADPFSGPAILGVVTVPYDNNPIYDEVTRKYVSVNTAAGATSQGALAATLERIRAMRTSLRFAESRLRALSEFKLTDKEKATIDVAKRSVEGLQNEVELLNRSICLPAVSDSGKAPACTEQAGALQSKVDKAIVPLSLASR